MISYKTMSMYLKSETLTNCTFNKKNVNTIENIARRNECVTWIDCKRIQLSGALHLDSVAVSEKYK